MEHNSITAPAQVEQQAFIDALRERRRRLSGTQTFGGYVIIIIIRFTGLLHWRGDGK